ncbi:bifunctional 5,10-methylenetetrahydrofolate dehydrogenase/5,10-methenyltetrahydrofolate cyclohydrolase, partial [Candidatus Gottesmanbacteria bacterium]|nr:bifunctional 5,10-methylenetetrahydrofolate dehydrogenase/5,10-methenyltetrahydrofolate cyclohydrolase [Candidatus Gottesmanbacteria bacterium]
YNHDPQVHGLILQRPLPSPYSFKDLIRQTVSPKKDVDGFLPASPFTAPVARAVLKILNKIYFTHVKGTVKPDSDTSVEFLDWFSQKRIVLLGKGETAGAPIAQTLSKFGILYEMVTSTTQNPEKYLGSGEVIISSIGKPDAVNFKVVRKEAILIGVGLASIDGKLVGDYDNSWAEQNTAFYTPTPGGVGPVNVACLMQNVCDGASSQFRLSI